MSRHFLCGTGPWFSWFKEVVVAMFKKSSMVVAIFAGLAASVAAFALPGPANVAALTANGVVTFGGASTVGNSPTGVSPANRTAAGDEILWTDTVQNNGAAAGPGQLTHTWDPAKSNLKPGSLSVPGGWRASYTTDGTTWADAEPLDPATVRGVRANATLTPGSGKPGIAAPLAPMTSTVSTGLSGAGDSFYMIFRQERVYSVWHHAQRLGLTCFLKVSGAPCGVITTTVPLFSSVHADGWVDQSTGRAYIPAVVQTTAPNSVVLACIDLDAGVECPTPYVTIGTNASGPEGSYLTPPWQHGNSVMFMYRRNSDGAALVACANYATMTPCAGSPFSAGLPFTLDPGQAQQREFNAYWSPNGVTPYRPDGKVSIVALPTGTMNRTLACFDSVTKTACAGVTLRSWADSQDPLPRMNAAGDLQGFCSRVNQVNPVECYDLLGNVMPASAAYEAWLRVGQLGWLKSMSSFGTAVGSKTLVSQSYWGRDNIICFDWATNAACPGFPVVLSSWMNYSLRPDPFAPSCVWTVGDDGIIENIDLQGPKRGCNSTQTVVKPRVCAAGGTTPITGWDAIKLNGLAGNYTSVNVTVRGTNGLALPGWSKQNVPAATSTINISSIPYSGTSTELAVELSFVGLTATAFVAPNAPTIEVTWTGAPLKMCMSTTVPSVCPVVYSAVQAGAVAHRSEAIVGVIADTVAINLAYDYITPMSCVTAGLVVSTTINGAPAGTGPGVAYRSGDPVNLQYSLTNGGTSALGSVTLFDDGGTAGTSDDITPTFAGGDTNSNGRMDPGETWTYNAIGYTFSGAHHRHPVATGTPVSNTGVPLGLAALVASDDAYYQFTNPSIVLTAGLYGSSNSGADCPGTANLYSAIGTPVTYCYRVTNTGDVPVATITVSDAGLGVTEATMSLASGSLATLAPGASVTIWHSTTNTGALVSTATASATVASGAPVTSASVTRREVGIPLFPPT